MGFIKLKYIWYSLIIVAIYLIIYQITIVLYCNSYNCCIYHNWLFIHLKTMSQTIVSTVFYFSIGIMAISIILTTIRHIKNRYN